MAFYIEVSGEEVRFPGICTLCDREGDLVADDRTMIQGTGFHVVAYTYTVTTLSFPVCWACQGKGRTRLLLGIALIAAPWVLIFGFGILAIRLDLSWRTCEPVWPVLTGFLYLGNPLGIGVLLHRLWARGAVSLVYRAEGLLVIGARSRRYADAFAALNDSVVEEKAAYVRFS